MMRDTIGSVQDAESRGRACAAPSEIEGNTPLSGPSEAAQSPSLNPFEDLLIAADDLCGSMLWVDRVQEVSGEAVNAVTCLRCKIVALGDQPIVHLPSCQVGQVQALCNALSQPSPAPSAEGLEAMLAKIVNKAPEDEHDQGDMNGGYDLFWALNKSSLGPSLHSILVRMCRRYVTEWRERLAALTSLKEVSSAYADAKDCIVRTNADGLFSQALSLESAKKAWEGGYIRGTRRLDLIDAPVEPVIEYEVEEHPWASEEGHLHPAVARRIEMTHAEAAVVHAQGSPFASCAAR
jgi:hypothetical protein